MNPTVSSARDWRSLRGFGPAGLVSFVLIALGNLLFAPLSAILVLVWARVSRTPWRELGFVRPRSWAPTVILGLALGVGFKLAMKSVVMPLFGADPVNHAYHFLAGNTAALPAAIVTMIVTAGFGEETLYRGYLFERLRTLWGRGAMATGATIAVTAVLFGAAHYPEQGRAGAEQAAVVGLVLGTLYALTGTIWMSMIAHAAFDLTAVAIIFWDLETRVAHWFFK